MNSYITDKEERIFKDLLSLSVVPEATFSYFELRGYLFGIAITPDKIPPEEWFPVIFGDEEPVFQTAEQARVLKGTLFSVLNKHIAAFAENLLFMPFDMGNIKESDLENIFDWTSGFEEALALRPECWEEQDELKEEEQDQLMNSLVVVEGIVYPEDAVDMFTHASPQELKEIGINLSGSDLSRVLQIQLFMLQALELAVETIQHHAMALEKKRKKRYRASAKPFEIPSSSIGKNEICPCGSGKKFRNCCGHAAHSQQEANKKGKLIRVDFSKGGKGKTGRTSTATVVEAGRSYELEISLCGIEPLIWRQVKVPGTYSLGQLHRIIQLSMGWQDRHMHRFQGGLKFYGPQLADDYSDTPLLDESRFSLSQLETELLQGLVYTYDFGDNWEHIVQLKKVIPPGEAGVCPVIVAGEGACPPEDVGGAPIFQEYLNCHAGSADKKLRPEFDTPLLRDFDPGSFERGLHNKLLEDFCNEIQ